MKSLIAAVLLLLSLTISAQDFEIKSLRTYGTNGETSFPIVTSIAKEKNSKLVIEFDVESDVEPQLKIVFQFCDLDWQPYENYFLQNTNYNTQYNLWFDRIPVSAAGADFHYKGIFPNKDVTFPFSGKWKYLIVDSHQDDMVFAEGLFFVVKPEIEITANIKKYKMEGMHLFPIELQKSFEINTAFNLSEGMWDNRVLGVEIIENRRLEDPFWIDRKDYDDFRFYEWDGFKKFKFTVRDIRPGNEYRTTDLRDKNRFGPPAANAQLDRLDTQQFYKKRGPDLNGGSVLTKYDNDYAEYFDVKFNFLPNQPFDKRIFLTGAFNNWRILPEYEMKKNGDSYSIVTELKRGKYDYQYVSAEGYEENIYNTDWYELEGNFWETSNEYFIFVYYQTDEKGGYDKIIGFAKLNSRGL